MSSNQALRQSELFSGEDWTVLYRAFNQINFNSYDPPSINAALRSYIQTNYPEEFNDWTENSEFVAIIDLLSWLAGSLAFRTDVNARENFLETAQSRESILRLARFLSYNPRRAQSARGLLKIQSVSTTQSITDSFGVNLNNQTITWNDPDNPDWQEQFTLVLNSAFVTTNQFGVPFKTATIGGAVTQLYRLTTMATPMSVYTFDSIIDGNRQPFEVVNMDIGTDNGFTERPPQPGNGFHMLYRNDGRGNASSRTGFFVMFKQGVMRNSDYYIQNPVENRVLDINADHISETDVWLQTLTDKEELVSQWEKVPGLYGDNITFNRIAPEIRDIFSVITRPNDQISLRFGDGRFGNAPVGNIRVWFRTVNGEQYTIRPADMADIGVSMQYLDISGKQQTLTLSLSLQESVSNALGSEDAEQIRRRAPQVYGTQNRMVSGEDYNVFPLATNQAVKIRAVNRVYSGHSRFVDINDPTSTFQDTVVIADDGIVYQERLNQYTQVPLSANLTPEQLVNNKIQPMLDKISLRDWIFDYYLNDASMLAETTITEGKLVWQLASGNGFSSLGHLVPIDGDLSPEAITAKRYLATGCKIQFKWLDPVSQQVKTRWTDVNRISSSVKLEDRVFSVDDAILGGGRASVIRILPAFRENLDDRPMTHITPSGASESSILQDYINKNIPFKVFYVPTQNSTLTFGGNTLSGRWISQPFSDQPPQNGIEIVRGSYLGGLFWGFEVTKGLRYVFESVKDVRWHNLNEHKVLDGVQGIDRRDTITVLWSDNWTGVTKPVVFDVVDNVYDPDGFPDYRKVVITPTDQDDDGSMDEPMSIQDLIQFDDITIYKRDYTTTYKSWFPQRMKIGTRISNSQYLGIDGQLNAGDIFYVKPLTGPVTNGEFFIYNTEGVQPHIPLAASEVEKYIVINGRNRLKFQWQHYSGLDIRIDPAPTNIIDLFVLTSEYNFLVRQWIKEGAVPEEMPEPPTDLALKEAFGEFEQYKMFSDELVWRPVKYKFLFGEGATPELKAQFKIVRLPNPTLSDGEIRSRVIQAINNYFDVNKWEFGETFYFTELAAYIHIQLSSSISSVAIVPSANAGKFGELFEVRSETNEVFISTAQIDDVVIIDSNTAVNLRIA